MMADSAVGAGVSTVTVRKSTLLKGRYYMVVAFSSTHRSAVGSTNYVFLTNCPPYSGSCTVSPQSGEYFDILSWLLSRKYVGYRAPYWRQESPAIADKPARR